MWEYCCESRGWGEYNTLSKTDQVTIKVNLKERLFAYLLISNSSNTSIHENVKKNLLEAFIAKRDEDPATRSDAIALLSKYDEKTNKQQMVRVRALHLHKKGRRVLVETQRRAKRKKRRMATSHPRRTGTPTRGASSVEKRAMEQGSAPSARRKIQMNH
jgi:hypothetical protein